MISYKKNKKKIKKKILNLTPLYPPPSPPLSLSFLVFPISPYTRQDPREDLALILYLDYIDRCCVIIYKYGGQKRPYRHAPRLFHPDLRARSLIRDRETRSRSLW